MKIDKVLTFCEPGNSRIRLQKKIDRKLKWARKRHKGNGYEKDSTDFSVHGAWSKGYFEGIIAVLEDLLDEET